MQTKLSANTYPIYSTDSLEPIYASHVHVAYNATKTKQFLPPGINNVTTLKYCLNTWIVRIPMCTIQVYFVGPTMFLNRTAPPCKIANTALHHTYKKGSGMSAAL